MTPDDPLPYAEVGYAVAIDGRFAVAGARKMGGGFWVGPVTVFERVDGQWVEHAILRSTRPNNDYGFGSIVDIDENVIVIGADGSDKSGYYRGAAYIFEFDGQTWTRTATVRIPETDPFTWSVGRSVAVDDGVVMVTSNYFVHVHERSPSGWRLQQTIDPPGPSNRRPDWVSLDGGTMVVSSEGTGPYVYRQVAGSWQFQVQLEKPAQASYQFARRVAVSGDTIVVGDPHFAEGEGRVHVHQEILGTWVETATLLQPTAAPPAAFGESVAIDDDVLVVGAPWDFPFAIGSAFVFVRAGAGWAFSSHLTADEPRVDDIFGFATAVQGGTVLVGAYRDEPNELDQNDDYGAVYSYRAVGGAPFGVPYTTAPTTLSSGSSDINTRPPCANAPSGCSNQVAGYTEAIASPGSGAFEFDLPLQAFDGHDQRTCIVDQSCTHWLKLNMTVSGQVPGNVDHNTFVSVADVQWLDSTGQWAPERPAQIGTWIQTDTPDGNPTLDFSERFPIPNQAFLDSRERWGDAPPTVSLRITPRTNYWDARGEAWNITIEAAQAQLVAPPVVMVHGWDRKNNLDRYDNDDGSWQESMEADLRNRATAHLGQDPWSWEEEDSIDWVAYDKKDDIKETADVVRQTIDGISGREGYDGPVDVVAHSMGGLVARALVEPAGLGADDLVRKLATVGTPHLGSYWADWWVVFSDYCGRTDSGADRFYLGNDDENVGVYDGDCWTSNENGFRHWRAWDQPTIEAKRYYDDQPMMANFELKDVNGNDGNPVLDRLNAGGRAEGIEYLLLGVRARGASRSGLDIDLHATGDGIVPLASAMLEGSDGVCRESWKTNDVVMRAHSNQLNYDKTRELVYAFLAVDQPTCRLDSAGSDSASQTVATSWSTPSPFAPKIGASGGSTALLSSFTTLPLASTNVVDSVGTHVVGTSAASQASSTIEHAVREYEWPLDKVDNVTFELVGVPGSLNQSAIQMRLPNGTILTSNGTLPEFIAWSGIVTDALWEQQSIRVRSPADGNWSLSIAGSADLVVRTGAVAVAESPYRLQVGSDPVAVMGIPTTIEVSLLNGTTPEPLESVMGSITDRQLNRTTTLQFFDDGAGPDVKAGDRVYTAQYTPISPGRYQYDVTVDSGQVVRAITRGLSVSPPPGDPGLWCLGTVKTQAPSSVAEQQVDGAQCLVATLSGGEVSIDEP